MLTSNYPPSAFLITILAALASQAASLPITATEISKRELNFGPPARGCVSVTFSLNQKADPLVERMWATAVKPLVFGNFKGSEYDGYVIPQEVWSAEDHGKVDDKNLIASDGGVWYFPDPEVFVAGSAKTKKQVEDDIAWTISTRV